MIGITVPPWEITDEHWKQLADAKPWETPQGRRHVPKWWRPADAPVQLGLPIDETGRAE